MILVQMPKFIFSLHLQLYPISKHDDVYYLTYGSRLYILVLVWLDRDVSLATILNRYEYLITCELRASDASPKLG